MAKHTVFVCKSCSFSRTERKYMGQPGGFHLLKQLLSLYQKWPLKAEFAIQEVDCLSACTRPCAIALSAPNKTTLLFGDLPPLQSAPAILQLSEQYYASDRGVVSRSQRPSIFKKGILAQIPPLPEN